MKKQIIIALAICYMFITNYDVQDLPSHAELVKKKTIVAMEMAEQELNEIGIAMQNKQLETQAKNIIYQKIQEVSTLDDRFVGFITMLDGMVDDIG